MSDMHNAICNQTTPETPHAYCSIIDAASIIIALC
jgi:hypothetical protein